MRDHQLHHHHHHQYYPPPPPNNHQQHHYQQHHYQTNNNFLPTVLPPPPPSRHHHQQQQHYARRRMPSPPCCSSGTSSLSQPISLDFDQQIRPTPSLQDLSSIENRWPPTTITIQLDQLQREHQRRMNGKTNTNWHQNRQAPPAIDSRHFPHHPQQQHPILRSRRFSYYLDRPATTNIRCRPAIVDLDALIGGGSDLDLDCSNERMMTFSSSEENLTTSESELGRVGKTAMIRAAAVGRRRFGNISPSLSPIHPDNLSLSLEDIDKMLATERRRQPVPIDIDSLLYRRNNHGGRGGEEINNERRRRNQQQVEQRKSQFMAMPAASEEDMEINNNKKKESKQRGGEGGGGGPVEGRWQQTMGAQQQQHYGGTGNDAIYAVPTRRGGAQTKGEQQHERREQQNDGKMRSKQTATTTTTMGIAAAAATNHSSSTPLPMPMRKNSQSKMMGAAPNGECTPLPITPQRIPPALQMVEEISPVLPRPNPDEDLDVPPLPRPLQISREWRPLQTSTLTNFQAVIGMPRTNAATTNNGRRDGGGGIGTCFPDQVLPLDHQPRSLFDPFFPKQTNSAIPASARPEQFNLPSALARSFGIRGILFIDVVISGSILHVYVRNAALFLDHPPAVCFVKVEIRRSLSNRKRTKYDHRFRSQQSMEVRGSSWPEFLEHFDFKVSQVHLKYGDKLGLAVYIEQQPNCPAELLGRMSFSLRKLFHVAKHRHLAANGGGVGDGGAFAAAAGRINNSDNNNGQAIVKMLEGGYFLLPDRKGQQTHLSQDNISYRKYYDEIGTISAGGNGTGARGGGCSSLSSASISSFGSPFKMMSEPEWPHHISMPPASFMGRPAGAAAAAAAAGVPFLGVNLASQKESSQFGPKNSRQLNSSQSSSSQSGVDCKRRAIPLTQSSAQPPQQTNIPSVTTDTTTSDFTSSIGLISVNSTGLALADYSACDEIPVANGEKHNNGTALMTAGAQQQQQQPLPTFELPSRPVFLAGGHLLAGQRAQSQPPQQTETAAGQSRQQQDQMQQQQPMAQQQPHHQHSHPQPQLPQVQPCSASTSASSLTSEEQAAAVRRVASFTCSPTASGLYKKRNSVAAPLTDKLPKKNMLGTFGKTLLKLKNKLDFSSLSASVLCPTKEECRLWQESFKALLNHKYGFLLFREFLQSERSEENLEFWEECEQLKRLKDQKKIQQKAQHIYDTYVKECTPKEVNLDSESRLKTKVALEGILVKTDVFDVAQNKIEQLMANDSYPRFLKSDPYLELLNEREAAEHVRPVMNGLVRVASAKWAGARERSPSPCHSPFPSSRWGRRNTCSPAAPATLQIPSIIKE